MRSGLDLTLWLVRHGRTSVNNLNETLGQTPTEPLDDYGKEQAKLLGARLRKEVVFDAVYVSSMLRAHSTFEIAKPNMQGTLSTGVDALVEINQGDVLGCKRTDVFKSAEDFDRYKRNGMGFCFPNGESQYDVQHRAVSFIKREILDNTHTRTDKHLNIALFSHGMTLKTILQYVLDCDPHMTGRIILDNTSISKVSLRRGDWFLVSVNDVAHLHNTEFKP